MNRIDRICNTCFRMKSDLQNVFKNGDEMLKDIILLCVPELDIDEDFPIFLCDSCASKFRSFEKFRRFCVANLQILHSYLGQQNETIDVNQIIRGRRLSCDSSIRSVKITKRVEISRTTTHEIARGSNLVIDLTTQEENGEHNVKEEHVELLENSVDQLRNEIIVDDDNERIIFESLCKNENGELDVDIKEEPVGVLKQDLSFSGSEIPAGNSATLGSSSDTTANSRELVTYDLTQNDSWIPESVRKSSLSLTSNDDDLTSTVATDTIATNTIATKTYQDIPTGTANAKQGLNKTQCFSSHTKTITSTCVTVTTNNSVSNISHNFGNEKILLLVQKVPNDSSEKPGCKLILQRLHLQTAIDIKGENEKESDIISLDSTVNDNNSIENSIGIGERNTLTDSSVARRDKQPSVRQIKCSSCSESFTTLMALATHKRAHPKPYECLKCNKTFGHLITHNVHKMMHIRKIIKFEAHKRALLRKEQKMQNKYASHQKKGNGELRDTSKEKLSAVTSDKENGVSSLNQNQSTNNTEQSLLVVSKEKFKCDICDKVYTRRDNLKRHTRTHFKETQCNKCNKDFSTVTQLRRHETQTCSRTFPCSQCGKTFAQLNHLKGHERSHARKMCKECHVSFDQVRNYTKHLANVHGIYSCDICNKSFKHIQTMREHELRHAKLVISNVPYMCKFCNKSYIRLYNLNKHKCLLSSVNGGNTSVNTTPVAATNVALSDDASVNLPSNTTAAATITTRPSPEGSSKNTSTFWTCTTCNEKFLTVTHLKIHLRTHHQDPTPTYKCTRCSKIFGEKQSLNRHKRSHKMQIGLELECDVCGRSFNNATRLKNHKNKCRDSVADL